MDLATVLLLHKSSFFIGALCFLYVRWQSPRTHGLGILAIAFILLAVASTVAGLGEKKSLPLDVWTFYSFTLGALGYAVFWIGIRRLSCRQERPFDWLVIAVPTLLAVVALVTGFHRENMLRATVFQGNSILFLIGSAIVLIHDARQEKLTARYALAAGVGVAVLLSLSITVGIIAPDIVPVPSRDTFFLLILCHFAIALFTLIFVKERAEATLTELLDTDLLTQIHNRRWFFSKIPASPRTDDAIIIIDIDHFKRVNDTFGHAAGDVVLAAVAKEMSLNLHAGEIFARLGGEEFGVYLPAALNLEPDLVAERLRNAVQMLDVRPGDTRIPLTISGGIAVATSGLPMNELMSMADRALYSAKALGRNRFELHRSAPSSVYVTADSDNANTRYKSQAGKAA